MPLDNLVADVLIHVLSFLDPIHIIRIRMMCKSLRDITFERSVWNHAFSLLLKRNHIHINIFHPESMSTAQLEDATTAPSRLIRKLVTGSSISCYKNLPTLSPSRLIYLPFEGPAPFKITLLPGGRFLLTESISPGQQMDDQLFTLIDLDSPNGNYEVHCQWSCPLRALYPDIIRWECVLIPSNIHNELRFVLIPIHRSTSELVIFHVVVENTRTAQRNVIVRKHTLHSSGTIHDPGRRLQSHQAAHDFLIFDYNEPYSSGLGNIVVWNFAEDKAIAWEWSVPNYQTPLIILNEFIVIAGGGYLTGWKIPDTTSLAKGAVLRLKDYPCAFRVEFLSHNPRLLCWASASWLGTENMIQVWDTAELLPNFGRQKSIRHNLVIWTCSDPTASHQASSKDKPLDVGSELHHHASYIPTSPVPLRWGDSPDDMSHVLGLSSPFTICEDHIVRVLRDDINGELFVHTTPLKLGERSRYEGKIQGSTLEPPEGVVVRLGLDPTIDLAKYKVYDGQISLDPFSGRVAVVKGGDSLEASIAVLHYL